MYIEISIKNKINKIIITVIKSKYLLNKFVIFYYLLDRVFNN